MHLMQILDVKNVVVVVTRWYGGKLHCRFCHVLTFMQYSFQQTSL